MNAEERIVTARVVTPAPLLRRGLERAATAAGFTVVDPDTPATVTLWPADGAGSAPDGIAVMVARDHLVVTLRCTADLETVLLLHSLLQELLDPR